MGRRFEVPAPSPALLASDTRRLFVVGSALPLAKVMCPTLRGALYRLLSESAELTCIRKYRYHRATTKS